MAVKKKKRKHESTAAAVEKPDTNKLLNDTLETMCTCSCLLRRAGTQYRGLSI